MGKLRKSWLNRVDNILRKGTVKVQDEIDEARRI